MPLRSKTPMKKMKTPLVKQLATNLISSGITFRFPKAEKAAGGIEQMKSLLGEGYLFRNGRWTHPKKGFWPIQKK